MKKYFLHLIVFLFFFILMQKNLQSQGIWRNPPGTSFTWIQAPSCDSCNGIAYITLHPLFYGSGPFYYSWSPSVGSANDTVYNLCSNTTYVITIRNGEETIVATLHSTDAYGDYFIAYTQARCTAVCNGSAYVSGTPAGVTITSCDWYPGSFTGDGTTTVSNLCVNQAAHCSITLSNGCIDTLSVTPAAPFHYSSITSFTSAICKDSCDGTANLFLYTVMPTFHPFIFDTIPAGEEIESYNWIPGTPTGDGTASVSNLCYGDYSCIITDTVGCKDTIDYSIDYIMDCVACYDCLSSFAPIPGKKYIVSGWVKEDGAAATKTAYTYPKITILSPSVGFTSSAFTPTGRIIDGWQKIEESFIIPGAATDLQIKLECTTGDCFFDDIRVFPTDGSMKSYVYDPFNMRLVAELDERNYATLYQYDEEGKLVRVKKETEKGVMTIKESRNNTSK